MDTTSLSLLERLRQPAQRSQTGFYSGLPQLGSGFLPGLLRVK
jgi:hypothetical protein